MPLKNQNKSKKALQTLVIRIRRIANRNPRNIRGFRGAASRLKKAFAGFLILLAVLFGTLAVNVTQNKQKLQTSVLPAAESPSQSCLAQTTVNSLSSLRTNKIQLIKKYTDLAKNSSWQKITELESALQNLHNEINGLEQKFTLEYSANTLVIARLENEVLTCPDNESCSNTKKNLLAAQNCEKQIHDTAIELAEQAKALKQYRFRDGQANITGKVELQKLFIALNQYRNQTDNQQALLQKCLADNAYRQVACRKSKTDFEKAWEAEANQMQKIAEIAEPLANMIRALEQTATSLKFAQINPNDFTPNQGLGWCEQSLQTADKFLTKKIDENSDLQAFYAAAVKQLNETKIELAAHLNAATQQTSATTAQLDNVVRNIILWKIFSGIF